MTDRRQAQSDVKKPISMRQLELVLAMFVSDSRFYQNVQGLLRPEYLSSQQFRHLTPFITSANEHYAEYERLPPTDIMVAEVNAWLDRNQADIQSEDLEEVQRVMALATEMTPADRKANRPKTMKYAQRFLEQSLQGNLSRSVSTQGVVDLPALLSQYSTQAEAVSTLNAGVLSEPFPAKLEMVKPLVTHTTGMFFDSFMNGGQAGGEVYGFAAPFGVCKTTVACQLAANELLHVQAEHQAGISKTLKTVYFVTYEEPPELLLPRFMSYVGACDKDPIEAGKWDLLSRAARGDYKPYERQRYKEQLARKIPTPAEYERVNLAREQMNKNLRLIDFSGSDQALSDASTEMEMGIRRVIQQDQARLGDPGVALVLIDYVGAAADRRCQAKGLDPDRHMRHLIGKFPLRVGHAVAKFWKCPVWAFHQLDTKSNARKAGVAPLINDTGEAKNFMENCVFGFMVGTKTPDSLAVMTCVKQRRARKQPDIVVKIDGQFSQVVSTEGAYRIDRGRIISAADYGRIVDATDDDPGMSTTMLLDDVGISTTRRR